jgi:diaminohydroxyphosphoribosylaminopyrimidine deaminase/5-amino-6-(5-phosphoribosylamino)uracil reductase
VVLGSGHTQRAGEAHAEVMALRDAQAKGHDVKGATAYVTLEPCSHQGRTGPCCDALAAAGMARVVVALQDPNPLVAGQGTARLRAADVQVDVGLLADEAHEINIGFFKRMTQGTPWVRMKIAASLDGQTALQNGVSQWLPQPPRVMMAMLGALAHAPCSLALALCSKTTHSSTYAPCPPPANPRWW